MGAFALGTPFFIYNFSLHGVVKLISTFGVVTLQERFATSLSASGPSSRNC